MILQRIFLLLVPILLILVLAISRQPSRGRWLLTTLAFSMVIAYLWVSARWDLTTIHARVALPILFVFAAGVGFRRIRPPEKKPSTLASVFAIGTSFALIILMSGFNWFSFQGYATPENPIDLASPLRDGTFAVVHGGASPFTNGHFRVRPQNFALDIVGLNAIGGRAGIFDDPSDLESYEIFGEALYSPCAGTVAAVVDEHADLIPPETDRENLAGNFVLIECNGVEVLLAHLKRGSILVAEGDAVTTASPIGQVGNTGNTSEPHLHIHAERGGAPSEILDGEAVPITLDGRFLVRGSVIRSR